MNAHSITPAQRLRLSENQAAVDEELDDMVEAWRFVRGQGGDFPSALFSLTQALLASGPSRDDLVRLVTYSVGRLAEGGGS